MFRKFQHVLFTIIAFITSQVDSFNTLFHRYYRGSGKLGLSTEQINIFPRNGIFPPREVDVRQQFRDLPPNKDPRGGLSCICNTCIKPTCDGCPLASQHQISW